MKVFATITLTIFAKSSAQAIPPGFTKAIGWKRHLQMNEGACHTETEIITDKIGDPPEQPDASVIHKFCTVGGSESEGYEMVCDASLIDYSFYSKICTNNGGRMFSFDLEQCPPAFSQEEEGDFQYKKITIHNMQQCYSKSCEKDSYVAMIKAFMEMAGQHCPEEKQFKKFALKYNRKGGFVRLRTCKWLQDQSATAKMKKCFAKRFQTYRDDYIPASQACPMTCKAAPFSGICVAENKKAKFAAEKEGELLVKPCSWLEKQDSELKEMLCSDMKDHDSKYNVASKVCTDTCGSCYSMLQP